MTATNSELLQSIISACAELQNRGDLDSMPITEELRKIDYELHSLTDMECD